MMEEIHAPATPADAHSRSRRDPAEITWQPGVRGRTEPPSLQRKPVKATHTKTVIVFFNLKTVIVGDTTRCLTKQTDLKYTE